MGDECSIWFNTVLRGDVNTITIGNRVNIQDGSVLHTLLDGGKRGCMNIEPCSLDGILKSRPQTLAHKGVVVVDG